MSGCADKALSPVMCVLIGRALIGCIDKIHIYTCVCMCVYVCVYVCMCLGVCMRVYICVMCVM